MIGLSRGSARSPLPAGHGNVAAVGAGQLEVGISSLAIRDLLNGPRREGRIVAALRGVVLAEFPAAPQEPRVIAISAPDTIRLPNAIIVAGAPAMATVAAPPASMTIADLITQAAAVPGSGGRRRAPVVHAGGGCVRIGGLTVQARRWWDPSPVFGPLSRARLDHGAAILGRVCAQADPGPALAGHYAARNLAACCASGDLAGAVEHAELLVGLGPGIVPSGDGILCGMLLALRLLGGTIPGGTRAVWLAGWLSAAVTSYARQRTTPLAATLLHCASRGQAAAEVSAVLHGVAGEEPVEAAARKLLTTGTDGLAIADLAWGLVAGCRAAQVLSVS